MSTGRNLFQWWTFPSVSSHRPNKIPKYQLFQPSSWPWSSWNNSSGSLVFHYFYDAADRPSIVFPQNSSLRSAQKTRGVDKCIQTTGAPSFSWSKWPCIVHSQSALCFAGFIWTESRFMIRNHSTAAVPGLTVSDVNFNISCLVHNRFRFLQVWCPTDFASSGHGVLLNFGPRDSLSY